MRLPLICVALLLSGSLLASADEFPTPVNTEQAAGAPMPPEEVCKTARLPAGFEMSVFAAEPDVRNPIAITTDDRGRLWVAENYSWAGAGAGGFDAARRDRIVILEDRDGDGRHDRRTVFWDEAYKLTSVEVGFGGVWALCLPRLLFIPDENRDDVPDGPPVVMLDGLDEGVVGHTPANGLKWGPDGWLYARHGIQATSSIGKPGAAESQRVKINTGIWRYHPTRGVVEAVMHGMTNSWGFDYDEHGEMFCINTVIGHLWHVVPGAHVERMYGIDINPHAYQLIQQCADHVHWDTGEQWNAVQKGISDKTSLAGGGHAHCGLLIYQGDNWPREYRGKAYTLNMHGRRINCDRLEREGSGYVARHEPDLAHFADPWFRGMDLITGPDGGVYIADWSDTGECHDHDGVHRTSGRIYKLTYGKPKKMEAFDLAQLEFSELVELARHGNDWQKRIVKRKMAHAFRVEQPINRQFPGLLVDLDVCDEGMRLHEVRAIQNLAAELSEDLIVEHCDALARLVAKETSGLVQLHIAAALQRMSFDNRWATAAALAQKKEFADDRMFPSMLWLGIEPAAPRDPAKAVALAGASQIPLVTQNIARRLTLEIERDPATVEKLLALAVDDKTVHAQQIVIGMSLALKGWRQAPMPANWKRVAEKFADSDSADVKQHVRALNIVFGDGVAMDELRAIATSASGDAEARRQALRALLAGKPEGFAATLQTMCGDRAVAVEVLRGLALYDDPKTPERILAAMHVYSPEARAAMIDTLATRPEYSLALLGAVRENRIEPSEISAFHARQIRAFDDAELTRQLSELWGDVRTTAAEKRSLIDTWKVLLSGDVLARANLPAGRALFEKSCKSCHVLYGVGRKVGPDLTGSNRKNLDYLLENILDPSASVGVDFRAVTVALDDGRVLSGVVSGQTDRTLTLQTDQEPIAIDRGEIEALKTTTNSLMPDGLLTTLTEEQVCDLLGYLMSTDQVSLPK